VAEDRCHYLIETKGREDVDVANRTAPPRSGVRTPPPDGWPLGVHQVPQKEKLQADEFADLLVFKQSAMFWNFLLPNPQNHIIPQ
jgi:hypothetical protein